MIPFFAFTLLAVALPSALAHHASGNLGAGAHRLVRRSASKRAQPWTQSWEASGESFFDHWDFFTEDSPTHGLAKYVDAQSAWDRGLVTASSTSAEIKVDHTNTLENGEKRNSVRITSKKAVPHNSLVILDLAKAPYGPASWPAFWT